MGVPVRLGWVAGGWEVWCTRHGEGHTASRRMSHSSRLCACSEHPHQLVVYPHPPAQPIRTAEGEPVAAGGSGGGNWTQAASAAEAPNANRFAGMKLTIPAA